MNIYLESYTLIYICYKLFFNSVYIPNNSRLYHFPFASPPSKTLFNKIPGNN